MPRFDPITLRNVRHGWPSTALASINRKVGALMRNRFHCKVGITDNPTRRWRQAYRHDGWKAMHILYHSSCHDHVCQLEKALIEGFDSRPNLPFWYYNWVAGGGGRKPSGDRFYLYLVTAPKWARATRRD